MASTPCGICIVQLTAVFLPFSTEKLRSPMVLNFPATASIIFAVMSFMVVASYKTNSALPLKSLSDRLEILVVNSNLSPSRKKRGAFGVTINSFCVTTDFVKY